MPNFSIPAIFIAILWVILIAFCRRRSWGIILWLPLFLGLTLWMLFGVAPLILMLLAQGPDAGWVAMGAMFSLMRDVPLIVFWTILLLLKPPKKTASKKAAFFGCVISPMIYIILYFVWTKESFLKIVDQNGNGLAHSMIHYKLSSRSEPELFPIRGTISTDSNGMARIRGFSSRSLDISSIESDGYELEPNTPQNYAIPSGAPENPIIFKMWETNIHEHLITGNKSFVIVPDGRFYFIDLTAGTINESGGGDLKVWIQYTNQPVRGQLYDWSAGIEVINGELCSSDDYSMYEAPTNNYAPSFSSKQRIKGGQSGEIGDHKFYLLLKNGHEYGQMSINLYAPYGHLSPGLVRLSYAINPSGSRILR